MPLSHDCHEALVILAARKQGPSLGRAYKRYSIWYNEQHEPFEGGLDVWWRCAICEEKIVSFHPDTPSNITCYRYDWMKEEAVKHGMKHLKDNNLLPFL